MPERVGPTTGIDRDEPDEEIVGYTRSPSDVLRLLTYGSVALALLALTRWATETITGLQHDVIALVTVPTTVERLLTGTAQLVVGVTAVAVLVPAFVLRRYRLLGYILVGNILTAALFGAAVAWLDRANLTHVALDAAHRARIVSGVLHPRGLGEIAASFIILAPFVSGRWRRTGMILMAALALARLLGSRTLPDDLFLALAIGATAGCIVLLAFGRPDRRPTPAAVRRALATSGLDVDRLEPLAPGRGTSTSALAHLADGSPVYAKVISPAERSADLLYRTYRLLRLREVGDERPFASLRHRVEHEALVSLQARDSGARTPRLRAIADIGADSMLLAFDEIEGRSLVEIPAADVDDRLLREIWTQVDVLHRHRIAHRDLQRASVRVDRRGEPWLVDFSFGETATDDAVLDADVAQLLTATALTVGAARAVDAAIVAMGAAPIGRALPLVQPGALRSTTRARLREQKGLLTELRQTIAARCAIAEPHYAPVERLNARKVLTIASLALATYFLFPQFADLSGIIEQVEHANWWWFPLVLAMSGVTYVGAALALSGSVPNRVPPVPALVTQVGTSFTSTLAPAGVGGMALNTRFLQKVGVDSAVAVSGVGLDTVAGLAMHVVLLLLFVLWAGSSTFGSIRLPNPESLLIGLAAVGGLAGIGFAIPAVRRQVAERVLPVLRRSADGIARTFRTPVKIASLLGGSTLVSIGNIAALFFAIQAFGGDLELARVGAVYLVGAAIATIAPTPGGLGALEAALIAGLVAAGMPNAEAVPAVFLYRFATFWIPILPGWIAFQYLQRADYV